MLRGSTRIAPGVDIPHLAVHLGQCLQQWNAYAIRVAPARIDFSLEFSSRFRNLKSISPYSGGVLAIDYTNRRIRYEIGGNNAVVLATLLLVPAAAIRVYESNDLEGLLIILGLWLLMCVGASITGWWLWRRFLIQALSTAPRAIS